MNLKKKNEMTARIFTERPSGGKNKFKNKKNCPRTLCSNPGESCELIFL